MPEYRYIQEAIDVIFYNSPLLEKKPGCPDGFIWRGIDYHVKEILREWHDYRRKGRMSKNMRETHASLAEGRGSWGVGVDNYRVRLENGQIFDIYYDRAPKNASHRKGDWYIYQEILAP
jgi:hypothetical protein